MKVAKLVATCLGVGYIQKGAGTVTAALCCLLWYFLNWNNWFFLSATVLVLATGIWASGRVEEIWGKDSNRVVVDEWLGMSVSLLFLPYTWEFLIAAFVLFRFFDIAKPLYIKKAEGWPGGWGVMADDFLAGVYTNVLLQTVLLTGLV